MTVTRRREGAVATRASAEEVFVDVGEVGATEEDAGVMSNAGDEDEMPSSVVRRERRSGQEEDLSRVVCAVFRREITGEFHDLRIRAIEHDDGGVSG